MQHVATNARIGTPVTFTIPPGTGSFSIVSQAVSATPDITLSAGGQSISLPNSVVPRLVKEPNGTTFYDDFVGSPGEPATALAFYGGLSPSTGAFTVPNTTGGLTAFASGVPPGQWNMTVGDFALECTEINDPTLTCTGGNTTNTYDITVLTKPVAGATGTVDVGIYLVTTTLTSAAAAATNPSVQRFIATLQILYRRAGLCLGNVTLYDVPEWAKTRFATGVNAAQTDPCSELDQMFTLSLPGKNELSFFFVDDIVQPTGGNTQTSVVGIDGTIPGPSSFGGTVHSGAVVNSSDLLQGVAACGASPAFVNCGADLVAYIAAHEGGHWMGLYHTTEGFGDAFDPVTDTGQCACGACAPAASRSSCIDNPALQPGQQPTEMFGPFCNKGGSCDGSQFLMFWLIDQTSVGAFSSQQGRIVRANPVVR
ncbi:MAG: hypothetical protein ACJ79U_08275 [Myxococcales bacterium]